MRHVFLPGAIRPGARGMVEPARPRALVAAAGSALLDAPGLSCASPIAVDVAAVAMGADAYLAPAARAEEQARGCSKPAMGEILPPHACVSHGCGARR